MTPTDRDRYARICEWLQPGSLRCEYQPEPPDLTATDWIEEQAVQLELRKCESAANPPWFAIATFRVMAVSLTGTGFGWSRRESLIAAVEAAMG